MKKHVITIAHRLMSRSSYSLFSTIVLIVMTSLNANANPTISLLFKDSTEVSDTVFTLDDIASVKGNDENIVVRLQQCKIGESAPPGYSRFISQDKIVQFYLQNTFKECTFVCTGPKRIAVRTAYKEYTIKMFSDNLYSYLQENVKWEKKCWNVTIRNDEESFRCRNAPLNIKFEGVEDGYPKGNIVLRMIITQGKEKYKISVYCFFSVKIPVIVTKKVVARQELISETNCEIKTMDITRFGPVPFQNMIRIKNMRASRTIKAGTILHERLVKTVPVVSKNDEVAITVRRGRISLAVPGIARESGGVGDHIWVKNKKSKKLIRAQIEKKGSVSVSQGS